MTNGRAVWVVAAVMAVAGSGAAEAQSAASIEVRETAGIRRNRFPVNVRVPLTRGALRDVALSRLMFESGEVEAQVAADGLYDDGSIQRLDVDFNATIGPLETLRYRLEYGAGIKAAVAGRGVSVAQAPDAIQLGRVSLNRSGELLLRSLNYRKEILASGLNGFTVVDNAGGLHRLTSADMKTEVIKPGPVYGVVRYTGRLGPDVGNAAFVVTVEMPNSKAWVKYAAVVEDPSRRLREISFRTPFALAAFPWVWDFGTGSWTYGSMRDAGDSVVFTQTVGGRDASRWEVRTGPKGKEQPYEVWAGSRPRIAEGWGHIQDAGEVVAFGFENFGRQPGTYTIALDGQGVSIYRLTPAQPVARHQLAIYQHYVASPTPIGAVTSPPSMLSPLVAVVRP